MPQLESVVRISGLTGTTRQSETLSDPESDFESSFKVYRNLLIQQSHQS